LWVASGILSLDRRLPTCQLSPSSDMPSHTLRSAMAQSAPPSFSHWRSAASPRRRVLPSNRFENGAEQADRETRSNYWVPVNDRHVAHSITEPPSVEEVIKRRRPLRNVNNEVVDKIGRLDKLAVWITNRVGTMGFFLVIFVWTVIWLGWNLLAPRELQFDPPMAFVFWLFMSNMIQILLMPLIMVGQNILGRHAETRAVHDLEVNVKAEQEIEVVLRHLEYQNAILIAMIEKLGVNLDEALRKDQVVTVPQH
jgi:uncharacterized membrane protein